MSEKTAASHDTGPPENLLKFMVTGWATPPGTPASAVDGIERFAARRDALSRAFPGDALIVPTGHEKVRANDTNHRFRPGTDFYYLTGNTEPDNVLVLAPSDGGHAATLYCEPNPGKTGTVSTFLKAYIPVSGGTRDFRITMPETAPWRTRRSENSI